LCIEYFIINLKGAHKLERMLQIRTQNTKRTKIISVQLIPLIEYFEQEEGD